MSLLNTPINRLDGTPATLGEITGGQPALLVNVASKCGLTPQYGVLEDLHREYSPLGFTVVGFPCNQFGGQEPGSSEEIAQFCSATYGVTFPMTEKIDVNGADRHAVYEELTGVADVDGRDGDVLWNFEKFLIDGDGSVVARFSPKTNPADEVVVERIEELLDGHASQDGTS
jgi:glutathione peroxidase